MKNSVDLSEDDIKEAITYWLKEFHGVARTIRAHDVSLAYPPGEFDPRGSSPESFSATATFDAALASPPKE